MHAGQQRSPSLKAGRPPSFCPCPPTVSISGVLWEPEGGEHPGDWHFPVPLPSCLIPGRAEEGPRGSSFHNSDAPLSWACLSAPGWGWGSCLCQGSCTWARPGQPAVSCVSWPGLSGMHPFDHTGQATHA